MSAGPPLPSQCEWLKIARETVLDDEPYMRADARRNRLAIVRILGWRADPETRLTRPTIAKLMEMTGLSRRAIQYHLRAIEKLGLVELVEPGTTAQFRSVFHRGSGNLARTYRLVNPFVIAKCTLPLVDVLDLGQGSDPTAPTRAGAREPGRYPQIGLHEAPQNRAEGLQVARAMQHRAPLLRLISAEHLRSLAAPLFAAGFSGGDVLHCLDYEPTGRQHGYTQGVRHLPGWFRRRVSLWLAPDGAPVPSPSQRRAAERERTRAEQAAWTVARTVAAEQAAGVDVAGHAARARAMLAARPRLTSNNF